MAYYDALTHTYLDDTDMEENFREYVNAIEDEVTIFGSTFSPADILEELDPVGFRTMLSDYEDMLLKNGDILDELPDEDEDEDEDEVAGIFFPA